MSGEEEKDGLTRRGFLGVSSAALAAAGMRSVENLAGQEASKSDRSSSDPGPTNVALDAANSDSVTPPDRCGRGANVQVSVFLRPQAAARRADGRAR